MPGEDFVEALRGFESATVASAIEALGVRDRTEGYADLSLRCLVPQGLPMVGYAVTFMVDSTSPNRTPDSSRFGELLAAVAASPQPCVLVCQESGPRPERGCHVGDLLSTRARYNGAIGVVSGSAVRDIAGLRELGMTAFALGTVAGRGAWTITAVGVDVVVAGLPISHGDLLHGDEDGLVSVPTSRPEDLLREITAVLAKEARAKQPASGEASGYPQ
jgi:4-hydroxy-4-methyl-2-oxoglutarate aldolase